MSTQKKDRLFDRRTVDRNIAKGLITQKEYEAYLTKLDDREDQSTPIKAEFVEGVLNEDQD